MSVKKNSNRILHVALIARHRSFLLDIEEFTWSTHSKLSQMKMACQNISRHLRREMERSKIASSPLSTTWRLKHTAFMPHARPRLCSCPFRGTNIRDLGGGLVDIDSAVTIRNSKMPEARKSCIFSCSPVWKACMQKFLLHEIANYDAFSQKS